MSQKPQSDPQSTQPEVPNSTQAEAQDSGPVTCNLQVSSLDCPPTVTHGHPDSNQEPVPIILTHQASIQEPPPVTTRRVSTQEPVPIIHTHRGSIQGPPPVTTRRISYQEPLSGSTRRVSIQEPTTVSTRGVSYQEPTPVTTHQLSVQEPLPVSTRGVSNQEPLPIIQSHQANIQEPPLVSTRPVSIQERAPIIHTRRVSIQEPAPIIHTRRVSIQEPAPIIHTRRVSIQEPAPIIHTRRVSIQEPAPIIHTRRVSIQEPPPTTYSRRASTQGVPSIIYNSWVGTREHPSVFQSYPSSIQSSHPLAVIQSESHSIQHDTESCLTLDLTPSLISKQTWPSVDVPPSITHSPEASIRSIETISWGSEESLKEDERSSQHSQSTLTSAQSFLSSSSIGTDSSRFWKNRRQSGLSISWRLLHEARKISRQLSLVLTLMGMVIIGLISLGQPWMHFRVPLMPPEDSAGFLTIPIDTMLFGRCPDVSCRHEYDKNAYLLDLAWAFMVIACITSFCLCVGLICTIFFTIANVPMLDFFLFICSIMTGTSIILGVLFYLVQAYEFLQEGMTYSLGISFYLSWAGVFLFMITGLFSYLNYINFWSILAIHAIWS